MIPPTTTIVASKGPSARRKLNAGRIPRGFGTHDNTGLADVGIARWYSPTMAKRAKRARRPVEDSPERSVFVTIDAKGRATLPEEVRRSLGIRGGDVLLLERTPHGTYELVPASLIPNDQLWFYHPEMQARIARAEADFAAGRYTTTRTPEEAQAFLDSLKKKGKARQ
jgi:AbrB family looped-hinge helix DNA binding protein